MKPARSMGALLARRRVQLYVQRAAEELARDVVGLAFLSGRAPTEGVARELYLEHLAAEQRGDFLVPAR